MGVRNAGNGFLLNNANFRLVNSPHTKPNEQIKGPYTGVYISHPDRWAIVACDWNNKPSLGIRWFVEVNGNPQSRNFATWYILPSGLHLPILNWLRGKIPQGLLTDVTAFLNGTMPGATLQQKYP
jgi:hypothetical protein